jgi:hypothetical protein
LSEIIEPLAYIYKAINYLRLKYSERKNTKIWSIESIKVPINTKLVSRNWITEDDKKKQVWRIKENAIKEKRAIRELTELGKGTEFVTILEPDNKYATFCWMDIYTQPFEIEFKIIGNSRTHTLGYADSDLKVVKNDWSI